MKTETGRRSAPVDPPAYGWKRVKLLADLDEGETQEAVVLRFDSSTEIVEDQWVEKPEKHQVRLWGCNLIEEGTHCTMFPYDGEMFVVKACC
jgi:hypothetical protein